MGCMSNKKTSSESYSQSYLPQQADVMKQMLGAYSPLLGAGQPVYEGQRVAPMNVMQEMAMGNLPAFLNALAPTNQIPLQGPLQEMFKGIISGSALPQPLDETAALTRYQQTRAAPAMEDWSRFVNPAIKEAYAGPGFFHTGRAQAQTQSAQDLMRDIGIGREEYMGDIEQINRQLALANVAAQTQAAYPAMQAATMGTTDAMQRLAGTTAATQLATMEQQQRQNQLNAEMQKFLEEQRITDPEVTDILLRLVGTPMSSGSSASYQYAPSPLMQLGAAALGAPTGGMYSTVGGDLFTKLLGLG